MQDEGLFHIVYASSATSLLKVSEIAEILKKSHVNNSRRKITGMLLYKDGCFMQVLEGPKAAVLERFKVISKDPRHTGILTLVQKPIEVREFSEWSMGFQNLEDSASLAGLPGMNDFLSTPLNDRAYIENPGRASLLLSAFRRNFGAGR